ncbi:MAG: hypothetical protein ACLQL2_06880 [Methylovirgula sp.]
MIINPIIVTKPIAQFEAAELVGFQAPKAQQAEIGLVGIGSENRRFIVSLDSFLYVEPFDFSNSVYREAFLTALSYGVNYSVNLARADSFNLATNAVAGDLCVSGSDILIAHTKPNSGLRLLNLQTGQSVQPEQLAVIAIFKTWSISVPEIENPGAAFLIQR